jgi:hypothetical protein
MGCEIFIGVARNHHAMENSHVFLFISSNISSSFEIELKGSLLEEALLSLEEDIFGLK